MLSNWPSEWLQIYTSQQRFLYDPVVVEAARRPGQFFWREIPVTESVKVVELFREARQLGMIDGFALSTRTQWPVVTALSVSGPEFDWTEADEGVVSLVGHTFMSRIMYLREQAVIPAVKALTNQERRLLEFAAGGSTDKVIAHRLDVSSSTIRTHWERLRVKLGASDRAQAVATALWSGEIVPS